MKKLIALLLTLLLCFGLAGACMADEEPADEVAEEIEEIEETEEEPGYFAEMLGDFTELNWYTVVILVALAVAGAVLIKSGKSANWTSRRIAYASMCIAIAFVLSMIRLYSMPQGGSITPASMLPLVLFVIACGPVQGLVVGCAYGMLQLIQDPNVIHPVQLLVDYPLAFGAVALAAVATVIKVPAKVKLPLAVFLAFLGRYIMAVTSGTVFFAEYAGDQNALVYSLVYNISYLAPDMVVCMIVACLPGMDRIVNMIRGKE